MRFVSTNRRVFCAASILFYMAAAFSLSTAHGQNRWALLIGINTYKNGTDDPEAEPLKIPNLRGSLNDVASMKSVLIDRYGFKDAQMKILTNHQATKNGIISGFEWVAKVAQPQDVVVVYYSGHGSQIPDQAPLDEPDKLDESICPYDASRSDWEADLHDDALKTLIERIPTRNLTLIVDSCCSGDVARPYLGGDSSESARPLKVEAFPQSASSKPETTVLKFISRRFASKPAGGNSFTRGPPSLTDDETEAEVDYILMSACRADEAASEFFSDGAYRSAFTTHLTRHLCKSPSKTTYGDLHQAVFFSLSEDKRAFQTPQLQGDAQAIVFHIPVDSNPPVDLWDARPSAPQFQVSLSTDRAEYAPKQRMKITFEATADSYIFLLNLHPNGEWTLLCPNPSQSTVYAVKAFGRHKKVFRAPGSAGEERFKIIAVRDKSVAEKWLSRIRSPPQNSGLMSCQNHLVELLSSLGSSEWAVARKRVGVR
jgi:metacaspase-1